MDPGWFQLAFDFLTGLFDRVGLRKNVCKTVGTLYQPCRAAWVRADKAYTRRMAGEVGGVLRSGSGSGSHAQSVGRSWQRGHC